MIVYRSQCLYERIFTLTFECLFTEIAIKRKRKK